jgi:endonuclease/exonuclease/phosphatase family metal-dependent hydrolase
MAEVRIATFNLENFDETAPDEWPSLAERIELMRPQIVRLRASIACFQEVNGQELPNQPRSLLALADLLTGTNLSGAELVSTRTENGDVYDERNLVVATTFPVLSNEQLRNDLVDPLLYRRLTAKPPDTAAVTVDIERPILHVQLDLPNATRLHIINVHLKSKIPTNIPGQKIDNYTWRSADAWAEGSFISSMKRMSQALEVRRLVDQILDADPNAQIAVAGDFNAAPDEVPVMAIRGDVENTGNPDLVGRVLVPIEHTIPAPARYTLYHQGRGEMLDHMLITRNLLAHYRGSEIHNEILHDESAAFAIIGNIPSPITPPS